MNGDRTTSHVPRVLRPVVGIGGRAAAATLRPVAGVASSAAWTALDSPQIQAAAKRALNSDGARQLLATFFESGLLDEVVDRLLASGALWRLVDELAGSPAVTAAITQQGLSFADQIGVEVRVRSRRADDWLERATRRLARRAPEQGLLPIDDGAP